MGSWIGVRKGKVENLDIRIKILYLKFWDWKKEFVW